MMKLDNYLKISAVSHPTTPAPLSQTSTAAAKKTPPSSTPFAKLPTSATIQKKKKTLVQTPRTSQTTTAAKTTPLAQSTAGAKSAATNVQKKRKSEGKITIWYLGEIESCNK